MDVPLTEILMDSIGAPLAPSVILPEMVEEFWAIPEREYKRRMKTINGTLKCITDFKRRK